MLGMPVCVKPFFLAVLSNVVFVFSFHVRPLDYTPRHFVSGSLDAAQGHIQERVVPYDSHQCNMTLVAYFSFKCVTQLDGTHHWRAFAFLQTGKKLEQTAVSCRRRLVPKCWVSATNDNFRPILQNLDTQSQHVLHLVLGEVLSFSAILPRTSSLIKFFIRNGTSYFSWLHPVCPMSTSMAAPMQYAVMLTNPPFFRDTNVLLNAMQSHSRFHLGIGFMKYILPVYPNIISTLMARPFFKQLFENGTLVLGVHHPLTLTGTCRRGFEENHEINQVWYANIIVLEYWYVTVRRGFLPTGAKASIFSLQGDQHSSFPSRS